MYITSAGYMLEERQRTDTTSIMHNKSMSGFSLASVFVSVRASIHEYRIMKHASRNPLYTTITVITDTQSETRMYVEICNV